MNRKHILTIGILLLAVILIIMWRWLGQKPAPMDAVQVTQSQDKASANDLSIPEVPGRKFSEQDKQNIAKIVQVFSAPIDFWGKVVDQNGQSIPNADVHYSVADRYFKDGSKHEGKSDENGLFSISGIQGAGLYVNVAKQGYYGTAQSGRSIGYGSPSGETPPTKEHPALFVLHKGGVAEPLINLKTGGISVPKDGTPKQISLRRERGQLSEGDTGGDIQIELWSAYQPPPPQGRRYDWRARISVPQGGLIERQGAFDFEAPLNGYVPSVEFTMTATAEHWQSNVQREYFFKLADGCYARANLFIAAGGDIFINVESYLNPISGHRNLEFDPANVVAVPDK